MVYDRRQGSKELSFEASGALKDASLVMRDRETDSWWSIMSSNAIGGDLNGADLEELPLGEKVTWGEWVDRYPDSVVLSVDGREHDPKDPYADYFESSETFRGLKSKDPRLPAKESIFAFHLEGHPWAIPHQKIFGGKLVFIESGPSAARRAVLLHRESGSAMFASSSAWTVDLSIADANQDAAALRTLAEAGEGGFEPLPGFDTFWYMWANVNEGSSLIE